MLFNDKLKTCFWHIGKVENIKILKNTNLSKKIGPF